MDALGPTLQSSLFTMIWFPASEIPVSPLLKIPILFFVATISTLAQTPPNPPPIVEESAKYGDTRGWNKLDTNVKRRNAAVHIYRVRSALRSHTPKLRRLDRTVHLLGELRLRVCRRPRRAHSS